MARLEDEGEALLKSEETRRVAEERVRAAAADKERLAIKVRRRVHCVFSGILNGDSIYPR